MFCLLPHVSNRCFEGAKCYITFRVYNRRSLIGGSGISSVFAEQRVPLVDGIPRGACRMCKASLSTRG